MDVYLYMCNEGEGILYVAIYGLPAWNHYSAATEGGGGGGGGGGGDSCVLIILCGLVYPWEMYIGV